MLIERLTFLSCLTAAACLAAVPPVLAQTPPVDLTQLSLRELLEVPRIERFGDVVAVHGSSFAREG